MLDRIERHADTHKGVSGRVAAFLLGFAEAKGEIGMTYDDDPYSPRSVAYDRGRNLRA